MCVQEGGRPIKLFVCVCVWCGVCVGGGGGQQASSLIDSKHKL